MKEIARFYDPEEAQIAAGFLKSQGFDVQLADEQALSVMPEMRVGLGGYRLLAANTDAFLATAALNEVRTAPRGPACRSCGEAAMRRVRNPAYTLIHAIFGFLFPFAPPTDQLRCRACGHTQPAQETEEAP